MSEWLAVRKPESSPIHLYEMIMFYESHLFDFITVLESAWVSILKEYRGIAADLTRWPEAKLHEGGWGVFGLYDFPHGRVIEANARRCPLTSGLIERGLPSHGAVGFSVLQPGTRVRPHVGYAGPFLRGHLALIVPEGECALRVGSETRRWMPGKAMVFDDRVEHEAWNLMDGERVVLLFDFIPGATMCGRRAP